jgi:hypothetical protein
MAGMERPEELLAIVIVVAIVGLVIVATALVVLIGATGDLIQKSQENGIRFSLRTLLIATTVFAVLLGLAAMMLGGS